MILHSKFNRPLTSAKKKKDHCWLLLVDAVVLNHDGAVLDVVSCAVYAALADMKLPNILVQTGKSSQFFFPPTSVSVCRLCRAGKHEVALRLGANGLQFSHCGF